MSLRLVLKHLPGSPECLLECGAVAALGRDLDVVKCCLHMHADLISDEEVALIVREHMDVGRILQDDERSVRSSNDVPGSQFSFLDVPVLRDMTTEFVRT